jgi:hypothetical protein
MSAAPPMTQAVWASRTALSGRFASTGAKAVALSSGPTVALRASVRHAEGEWARDDDGIREVHDNTMEGLWNFLRAFRGVSKEYLYPYVVMFEWGYNVKRAPTGFLWALLGVRSATCCPT